MTREQIIEHRRMLKLKLQAVERKAARLAKEIEIYDALLKRAPKSKLQQLLAAYEEL